MFLTNLKSNLLRIAVLAALAPVVRVQAQSSEQASVEAARGATATGGGTAVSFEPQSPAAKATRSWYGWQTLSADALSIGLIALGGALESQATAIAGVASLHLASPLIHFVHGRSDAGWLSAGGRVASTALLVGGGALVMEEAFDDSEDQHGSTKETAGAIMATIGLCGMAAMIALDATFAVDRHAPSDRPTAHLQLIPWMTRDSQGATMQVSLQM